jgi:hypothetical protein
VGDGGPGAQAGGDHGGLGDPGLGGPGLSGVGHVHLAAAGALGGDGYTDGDQLPVKPVDGSALTADRAVERREALRFLGASSWHSASRCRSSGSGSGLPRLPPSESGDSDGTPAPPCTSRPWRSRDPSIGGRPSRASQGMAVPPVTTGSAVARRRSSPGSGDPAPRKTFPSRRPSTGGGVGAQPTDPLLVDPWTARATVAPRPHALHMAPLSAALRELHCSGGSCLGR